MTETTWHILRCAPQRERWLANELRVALGLHTYVPIERNVIVRRGKKIEVPRPLVPGYVFAMGIGEAAWRDVAETRHVTGWLTINGRPAPIKDAEIGLIRSMERLHNKALHDRRVFKVGERVRVSDSPFASMDVLLRSVRGSTATIEVQMLGSTRGVKVPVSQLEKVA